MFDFTCPKCSIVLRSIGEDDRGLPLLIKAHEELHTAAELEWEAKLCRHRAAGFVAMAGKVRKSKEVRDA